MLWYQMHLHFGILGKSTLAVRVVVHEGDERALEALKGKYIMADRSRSRSPFGVAWVRSLDSTCCGQVQQEHGCNTFRHELIPGHKSFHRGSQWRPKTRHRLIIDPMVMLSLAWRAALDVFAYYA